ncbi:MAG: DUF86 domain-containing protein [Patescibacteria group bacterium]
MIDDNLVSRKLKFLSEYFVELEKIFSDSTDEEVLTDSLKYHAVERLFQLLVDTMIDINIHVIRGKNVAPPDDLESTFITLGKGGVLPEDFSVKIAPVVGLRNRVVHRYESLNRMEFIVACRKNLSDFKKFYNYIAGLLKG